MKKKDIFDKEFVTTMSFVRVASLLDISVGALSSHFFLFFSLSLSVTVC